VIVHGYLLRLLEASSAGLLAVSVWTAGVQVECEPPLFKWM
jgi:hypothetical protein